MLKFDYIRTDLYLEDEKIYIREMTFVKVSKYYKIEAKEIGLYLEEKWKYLFFY